MARGRPHGRSKSDHRVCQAARYERAAEYRERISISAEQQEARIAAVNAECDIQDAPQKRRSQKSIGRKKEAWTACGSAQRGYCKASGSGKKKANQRLRKTLGKAAERDLHSLHCNACGATAEFGLRGGKDGGSVKYSCRAHATLNGCFRIDRDRAAWAEAHEMRRLRLQERRLEEELQNLGGTSFAAKPTSAWNELQSMGDWASEPMSKSLIATLLMIGGIEVNPGPTADEIKQNKESWLGAYPDIDRTLLDYLALKNVKLAKWRESTSEQRSSLLDLWARRYTGEWLGDWDMFLIGVPAAGRRGQDAKAGQSADVEMRDAGQGIQNRRKKYIGDMTEGINNRSTEAYSSRAKTVDKVIDAIDELGAVLVRAPPQSGKTSLLQLVEDKLASMQSKVYYVSLGLYDPTKEDSFERLWAAQHPGVDFNNLAASPKNSPESQTKPAPPPANVYLLVDEAQAAFCNHDLELFKKMKEIRSGRSKSPLRILLVSCWGSKRIKATSAAGFAFCTPGSWTEKNTIGLWQKPASSSGLDAALQFTVEEAEEYWSGWLAANGWSGYSADRERNYLFVITQRQPGALSHLLDCIKGLGLHRLQVSEAEWHRKVQAWLLSEKLIKSVADLRSMSMLVDAFDEGITGSVPGSRIPAVAVKDLVRKMLHGGELKVHSSQLVSNADENDAALTLTRLGQLILEQEFFYLPSLLHVRYMTRQLYLGRTKDAKSILDSGIFEFVASVVERLDPVQLSESDSCHSPGSALYERQYQNSFYQAAMSYLPHDAALSPDAGYLYGADGYLDFLLGLPFRWGFELLREGSRRQEHLKRFGPGGKYVPLLDANAVQQWVVIDFCWKKGDAPAELDQGLIHVSFSENFTQAVVRASDKQKTVDLRGLRQPALLS